MSSNVGGNLFPLLAIPCFLHGGRPSIEQRVVSLHEGGEGAGELRAMGEAQERDPGGFRKAVDPKIVKQ